MSLTTDPTTVLATGAHRSTAEPTTAPAFVRIAAGLALVAFPLLFTAGIATSPPQASDSTADYVASLGADPALTALSAGLLHYSWVAFALGVLATIGLSAGAAAGWSCRSPRSSRRSRRSSSRACCSPTGSPAPSPGPCRSRRPAP